MKRRVTDEQIKAAEAKSILRTQSMVNKLNRGPGWFWVQAQYDIGNQEVTRTLVASRIVKELEQQLVQFAPYLDKRSMTEAVRNNYGPQIERIARTADVQKAARYLDFEVREIAKVWTMSYSGYATEMAALEDREQRQLNNEAFYEEQERDAARLREGRPTLAQARLQRQFAIRDEDDMDERNDEQERNAL